MKTSSIGWTDYSGGPLNFILRGKRGDCECSAGCANCYSLAIGERFGILPEKTTCYPDKLAKLATVRFPAYSPKRGAPHKPMAFLADMGDLFHEDVPGEFIYDAFAMMKARPDVTWQVLTKRAKRMHDFCAPFVTPPNVFLGVTAENQATADERIPLLLDTPAAVRFVSVEPMLEPIVLEYYFPEYDYRPTYPYWQVAYPGCDTRPTLLAPGINWVICGAESGPNRRPFDVCWAADLYEQCKAARVAFFGKQDSALRPGKPLVLLGYGVVQEWPTP